MATPKKKPEDLQKAGRKPLYKPEFCEIVIELGRIGKTKAQIGADPRIDVARQTLDNWCLEHPEFFNAMTRARDLAMAYWEEMAEVGMASVGFNSGLWGKIMSCRFPDDYRENKSLEVTGKGGKDLMPQPVIQFPENLSAKQMKQFVSGLGMLGNEKYDTRTITD
jgi:hypothetical protein